MVPYYLSGPIILVQGKIPKNEPNPVKFSEQPTYWFMTSLGCKYCEKKFIPLALQRFEKIEFIFLNAYINEVFRSFFFNFNVSSHRKL